jgi:pyruvate dehydrogenase E2 component (dihydrolipoamide acetyltransferase)
MTMIEFRLPELGENVAGGDVSKVLVKPGDSVQEGQPLLELETDKAAVEVPSPAAGTVREVRVKAGSKAKVGDIIFVIEAAATAAQAPATAPVPSPPPALQAPIPVPPSVPKAAPTAGSPPPVIKQQELTAPLLPPELPRRRAPAAPSVRRLAREIGIDIEEVKGTGPGGRISEADVKAHAKKKLQEPAVILQTGRVPSAPLPDFSRWGEIERKAMTSVRRKTAEHMAEAWATVPQVTQYDQADITDLEQLRQKYASKVEKAGGKLTVTAILLKIVSSALRAFPQFNASINPAQNEIIYKKYVHLGVAVDTERGLLVPVIREVDRKNILELSLELTQLAEKARSKKITLEDLQGGTFTITNLGGIGGTMFSPIVNTPEVAILGVSRSSLQPIYYNGTLVPRLLLPLSLSYDHRLIDGADGARFLRWVAEALQNPFLLMLEG